MVVECTDMLGNIAHVVTRINEFPVSDSSLGRDSNWLLFIHSSQLAVKQSSITVLKNSNIIRGDFYKTSREESYSFAFSSNFVSDIRRVVCHYCGNKQFLSIFSAPGAR